VVATPDPAVREVGGDAIAYAEPREFAQVLARVLADPEPWSRAGLERARAYSWERAAQITVDVYREALS
jgi:glycosyltransferase involved in cell wall biosynthesis